MTEPAHNMGTPPIASAGPPPLLTAAPAPAPAIPPQTIGASPPVANGATHLAPVAGVPVAGVPVADATATTVQGVNGLVPTVNADGWGADITPEQIKFIQQKGWPTPKSVVESYQNLERVYSQSVRMPGADASAEAREAFSIKMGRPAAPEGYPVDAQLMQDSDVNLESLTSIKQAAFTAGVSVDQWTVFATQMAGASKAISAAETARITEYSAKLEKQMDAHPNWTNPIQRKALEDQAISAGVRLGGPEFGGTIKALLGHSLPMRELLLHAAQHMGESGIWANAEESNIATASPASLQSQMVAVDDKLLDPSIKGAERALLLTNKQELMDKIYAGKDVNQL